jgi:hypothetical protein
MQPGGSRFALLVRRHGARSRRRPRISQTAARQASQTKGQQVSTSASNIKHPMQRQRICRHRKFNDGMTTAEFHRAVNRGHRDFFLSRGIDPDSYLTVFGSRQRKEAA